MGLKLFTVEADADTFAARFGEAYASVTCKPVLPPNEPVQWLVQVLSKDYNQLTQPEIDSLIDELPTDWYENLTDM